MLDISEREKYANSAKIFLDSFYYLKDCSKEVLDIMKNSAGNEDDPLVQEFAKNFTVLYDKLINNQALINAYNIDEKLHYYRLQSVARVFYGIIVPFNYLINNGFFNSYRGRGCNYRSIADLLEKCNTGFDRTFSDKLCDYYDDLGINEDKAFVLGGNEYFSLDEEVKEYFKAKEKNANSQRFINFYNTRMTEYYYSQDLDINYADFQKEYESSVLGNIGELLYFENIKNKPCAIFTARDVGSHVGCDMTYYDDRNRIERLIEVKTTAKYKYDGSRDELYIGSTELPILEESLTNPNIHYEIKRVFIRFNENGIESYDITTLIPRDKETLIDEDGNVYRIIKTSTKNYVSCETLTRKNKLVRN